MSYEQLQAAVLLYAKACNASFAIYHAQDTSVYDGAVTVPLNSLHHAEIASIIETYAKISLMTDSTVSRFYCFNLKG